MDAEARRYHETRAAMAERPADLALYERLVWNTQHARAMRAATAKVESAAPSVWFEVVGGHDGCWSVTRNDAGGATTVSGGAPMNYEAAMIEADRLEMTLNS